jgi:hypothetical protein
VSSQAALTTLGMLGSSLFIWDHRVHQLLGKRRLETISRRFGRNVNMTSSPEEIRSPAASVRESPVKHENHVSSFPTVILVKVLPVTPVFVAVSEWRRVLCLLPFCRASK